MKRSALLSMACAASLGTGLAAQGDALDTSLDGPTQSEPLGTVPDEPVQSESLETTPDEFVVPEYVIELPVLVDDLIVGDLGVHIHGTDVVGVDQASWQSLAQEHFSRRISEALSNQAVSDVIAMDAFVDAGFGLTYDPLNLTIMIDPSDDQRRERALSSRTGGPAVGIEMVNTNISGYVNFGVVQDFIVENSIGETGREDLQATFDGAVRLFGHEGIAFVGSIIFDEGENTWLRGDAFAVYDDIDRAIRYSAGDVFFTSTEFLGAPPLLGAAIERRYDDIQPLKVITSTGDESFTLRRPSRVEIYVNGAFERTLQLLPGRYNLSDFSFADGLNDIRIVVEDNTGQRETYDFSLFLSSRVLAKGVSEFSLSGGVQRSDDIASEIDYDFEDPAWSGFFRYGFTGSFTAGLSYQGDSDLHVGGVEATISTGFGAFSTTVNNSWSGEYGEGLAGTVQWNFNLARGTSTQERDFEIGVSYVDENFLPLGRDTPSNPFSLRANARYSQELPFEIFGSLSGRWGRLRDASVDEEYGVGLSLTRRFGTVTANLRTDYFEGERNETSTFVSLSLPLVRNQNVVASYDSGNSRGRVTWNKFSRDVAGDISGRVSAESDEDNTSAEGEVVYRHNRFIGQVRHDYSQPGRFDGDREQRTRLQFQTGFAFAGRRAAVGRPITDSFAIVSRHKTLRERPIEVNARITGPEAVASVFGPALISNLDSYRVQSLNWDVRDLPVGYDLGDTSRSVLPTFRSGSWYQVGSAASYTVVGTALDADGLPVSLAYGEVKATNNKSFPATKTFTNQTGRFAVQNLEPGRYVVEFAGLSPIWIEFEISEDDPNYLVLGELRGKQE